MFSMIIILGVFLAATVFVTSPQIKDAALKLTRALPASTSAVTSTTAIDTGPRSQLGTFETRDSELLLTAPALTTSQLPDSKTMTYVIIASDNADLSSPVTLSASLIVQTGAGGAGAAGNSARFKLSSDVKRYIGFTITPSASGTGDASGASATLEMMF